MKILCVAMGFAVVVALALPGAAQTQEAPPVEQVAPLQGQTQPSDVPQSVAPSGQPMIDDWEDGRPIPPGYHPSTRIRKGPVIAGSIVFGVLYLWSIALAAVGAALHSGSDQVAPLCVPGIGPFAEMVFSPSRVDWLLALDGIAQSGGIVLLAYGIAAPRSVLVRDDLGLHIMPAPMTLGRNGGGFGLVGSF